MKRTSSMRPLLLAAFGLIACGSEPVDFGAKGDNLACDPAAGEGFAEGQLAQNWTLQNADGEPVSLYDHCGKVVFFESGAEW